MSKKSPSKKEQKKAFKKEVTLVTDRDIKELKNRALKEEYITPSEFDVVLRRAAQDVHKFVEDKKKSPIEYLSVRMGVSTAAINSYIFTAYGVFQKDQEAKMHPYVAFTLGLIHAINIGCILGELRQNGELKGDQDGPDNSASSRKNKPKSNKKG